jgi:hypothetical protein
MNPVFALPCSLFKMSATAHSDVDVAFITGVIAEQPHW